MRIVLLVAGFLLLLSCKTIRQISREEILIKPGCEKISFEGKIPVLAVDVENKKAPFIFDTGAMISALLDSTVIENFSKIDFSTFGATKGANGKKVSNRRFTAAFKSNLFESSNKVLTFISMPISTCIKQDNYPKGILGLDVFFENDLSMQLDFTNGKVCNITAEQFEELVAENKYILVKSKCKMNQIAIYITIEGKEYPFYLDTGYTGNIIMPYRDKLNVSNAKKIEFEGSFFQTIASQTSGKEFIYEKIPVVFGAYEFQTKINVSTSIKAQLLGISFIKAFDWLIDYNHNKVYIKRNQNPIENNFSRKVSYYAKADQGKLLITVKEKSQVNYHLGDQILAVNGQKVTSENQCELQDLLNKTEDWNSLSLEVIPAQK